tara:strand:+ start:325 stop:1308 length:984 start_codon:yes stop_codon:yes gene_type:complete
MKKIMQIYSELDEKTKQFEKEFGIINISKTIDDHLSKKESLNFIDDYRKLIRTNDWFYNDNITSDYDDLLDRWLNTHKFYITSAKEFFKNIQTNYGNKTELMNKALLSETLRGREGKRSNIGLDNFLESYISKLNRMLSDELPLIEREEALGLFSSTIEYPLMSAENELFFDYADYKAKIKEDLTFENFEEIEKETNGLCSKILREYCKYSFADFNDKSKNIQTSSELCKRKKDFLRHLEKEKEMWKDKMHNSLLIKSGKEAADFLRVSGRINELNYLNSNIEVKFSFKGWPGILHHLILKENEAYPNKGDIYHGQFIHQLNQVGGT